MPLNQALLPEFDHEMANTRKTLERVPEDKFAWKPHEKSGTMIWLAHHLSQLPSWAVMTIEQDALDMATMGGARVIGTVSTDDKAKLAREAGADDVILYTKQDFEVETKRLTSGKGIQVVYDSVGKTTFDKGFNVLAPRGMMILYGQSSGPVAPFDAGILGARGSLFLTRPSLVAYTATRDDLLQRAGDVLGWIRDGKLKLRMEFEFPLKDVAEAHRALESRKTTGKVLLIP